jgi:hypothetical protein
VPRIFEAIHRALPQWQEALASAKTAEEYLAAVKANPTDLARGKRTQVFIERCLIDWDYDPVTIELNDVSGTPFDQVDITTDMNREGFIVELRCRTPNSQAISFVVDEFMRRLREEGRKPGQGFFINRVVLTRGSELVNVDESKETPTGWNKDKEKEKPTGRASGRSSSSSSRSTSRGRFIDPKRGQKQVDAGPTAEFYEGMTHEPMDSDWAFTVVCDVLLNDYPEPEPEEEAPADGSANG